jgi:histidinol-phosphate phosphatase family protein
MNLSIWLSFITNQPVIARGECSFEELNHIHNRLYTLLGREGAYLDGLYFCPHHPDKGFEGEVLELKINCDCRKPKTGMLKRAEADFNADLSNSWFIGDTTMDVQTGKNAGMHTIMLRSGDPKKEKFNVTPDAMADDLLDAVKMILSGENA